MSGGCAPAAPNLRSGFPEDVRTKLVAGYPRVGLNHESQAWGNWANALDPLMDCLRGHLQVARYGGLRHRVSVDGCLDCAHE